MKHTTSRLLYAYWDKLRAGRAAPDRGQIEPGEIRHILADMFILELGGRGSGEFRLAGTRLCALFGRELKGSSLASLWGDPDADLDRLVDTVTFDSAGIVAGLVGRTPSGNTVNLELLLLPLRHRGKTQTRALGAISAAAIPAWLGFETVTAMRTTSLRILWPTSRTSAVEAGTSPSLALERRRALVVLKGGLA